MVASTAAVPVGLIFYHFQTLDGLMLAVLDHTSAARLPRWRDALDGITDAAALLHTMGALCAEDAQSGHAVAVRELVANAAFSERFSAEMGLRMEPWFELAEAVAARVLEGTPILAVISARHLAMTAVALYLGLDVVSRLAGDTTSAAALAAAAERIAPLVGLLPNAAPRPRRVSRRITLE